jgi:hypothetical protein
MPPVHPLAVTQNFVSSVNLPKVLSFLRPGRAELVSGCAPEQRWVDAPVLLVPYHTHQRLMADLARMV